MSFLLWECKRCKLLRHFVRAFRQHLTLYGMSHINLVSATASPPYHTKRLYTDRNNDAFSLLEHGQKAGLIRYQPLNANAVPTHSH